MNLTSLDTKEWHTRATKLRYETEVISSMVRFVDSLAKGRFAVISPASRGNR